MLGFVDLNGQLLLRPPSILWISKLCLVPVVSVAFQTRVIERTPTAYAPYMSIRVRTPVRLTNQGAASQLRQSGRLSGHHA